MKKKILTIGVIILCVAFTSCGDNDSKDSKDLKESKDSGGSTASAASIAQKWCELNGMVYKAEGDAKEAAKKTLNEFENELETKYKDDKAFMKEIENESEKCEEASEGR